MIYYIFKWNYSERNRCIPSDDPSLAAGCCTKKSNLSKVTVFLTWTVSTTKAKHRNKPDNETDHCKFRPLEAYHVLSTRVHYNNGIPHTEKLTHNNYTFLPND